MKINGHGQSKVLTVAEIDKLFAWEFANSRDRLGQNKHPRLPPPERKRVG
jgi:hypothetical protein